MSNTATRPKQRRRLSWSDSRSDASWLRGMTYRWESPHRDISCSEMVFPWARWSPLSIFKAQVIDTNLTYGGYAGAMVMIPWAFTYSTIGAGSYFNIWVDRRRNCSNEYYSNVYTMGLSLSICCCTAYLYSPHPEVLNLLCLEYLGYFGVLIKYCMLTWVTLSTPLTWWRFVPDHS